MIDQMLTGFDSKWLNTLYLDKILDYANLIQAFSRTNRLCDKTDKPFGLIRYYRKPHTMQRNIERAVKLYSGDRPMGLFVDNLDKVIDKMNVCFADIADIFKWAGLEDFSKKPMIQPHAQRLSNYSISSMSTYKLLGSWAFLGKNQAMTWYRKTTA